MAAFRSIFLRFIAYIAEVQRMFPFRQSAYAELPLGVRGPSVQAVVHPDIDTRQGGYTVFIKDLSTQTYLRLRQYGQ